MFEVAGERGGNFGGQMTDPSTARSSNGSAGCCRRQRRRRPKRLDDKTMKEIGKRVRRIYKLSNKSLGEDPKTVSSANSLRNITIPVYFILISRPERFRSSAHSFSSSFSLLSLTSFSRTVKRRPVNFSTDIPLRAAARYLFNSCEVQARNCDRA